MKEKFKSSNLVRENYRRLRKISLHIAHGRFYSALKLANHYNPIYRLTVSNPVYLKYRRQKKLYKALDRVYSYPNDNAGELRIKLIFRDGDFLPRSSAFIRLIGPLSDDSMNSKIKFNIESAQKLSDYNGEDFFIVQRTAFDNLKQAKNFASQAKQNGVKIIVDNDDAFHDIDPSHPEYYLQTKRLEAVRYLMDKANQIWVSTSELAQKELKAKTKVVANSLDHRLWRNEKPLENAGPINLVYMGTATHDSDLEMIIPVLDELHKKYPQVFNLSVIGVSQDLPDRTWIKRLTTPYLGSLYPDFVQWFLNQGPFDIGLSPLVDSAFNKSKSDIKCLDYLAAGILPVVSDVLPYQSKEIAPFIIKVKNDETYWLKVLSEIVENPGKFRSEKSNIIPKAQKYIWQERSSTQTAKVLLNNLESLIK